MKYFSFQIIQINKNIIIIISSITYMGDDEKFNTYLN